MKRSFLYSLPAPAKLNLFLHVVGRRCDGKHLLESVFVLIDLCDEIDLEERSDGKVVLRGCGGWDFRDDLTYKAAMLLKERFNIDSGVDITLRKNIPVGAGMGGGSSDAATALIGLNKLWRIGLDRSELAQLGLSLGADVPFFINGENSFVEGIGEVFTPLKHELPKKYIVVWPGTGVSTKEIFSDMRLTRDTKSQKIAFFSEPLPDLSCSPCYGRNDLQPVAVRIAPSIGRAIDLLNAEGIAARMTGSGSAVFASIDDLTHCDLKRFPADWKCFMTRALSRHPLQSWC